MTITYRNLKSDHAYRIGSDGTIWSRINRGKHGTLTDSWRQLKPRIGSHGYKYVNIRNGSKKTISVCVHALVLTTFCGPRPEGMEACHGVGGPLDNSIDNLRWDTKQANESDKLLHGTLIVGERHYASKLCVENVIEIRKRFAAGGIIKKQLAKEFGVDASVVSEIISRKSWRHVA